RNHFVFTLQFLNLQFESMIIVQFFLNYEVLFMICFSQFTEVSELISIVSSLWSTGVMSFLGGFLLTSVGGPMNLWISIEEKGYEFRFVNHYLRF
ncbi:hypothetical protein L9F63_007730, partial [Diploptera punctata]